jgi:UDP-4-amino-4,6-dideoxy-N-acetyl-beta-L-altrosamine N-acetyltransferase
LTVAIEGRLRPMVETDLDMVLAWRNQEPVRRNMYTYHEIQADEHARWWAAKSVDPQTRLMIFERDDEPIGFVSITDYTGEGGTAMWAFYAGANAPKGTGRLMEYHALRAAFEELKVRKLSCEVLSFNQPVIGMHQRYGFALEGIFREAYVRDGEPYDVYRLSLLAADWFRAVKGYFEAPSRDNLAGKVFQRQVKLDDESVRAFAAISGDTNPIHFEDAAAQAMGFPRRITHGLLSVAQFSGIFGTAIDPRGLVYLTQSAEFLRPVFIDSEADVEMKVLSHVGRRIVAETTVSVDGAPAIRGTAALLLPKSSEVTS